MTDPFTPSGNRESAWATPSGRARTWANLLDSLIEHETPDQRWLRNAGERLRGNPEIYEENNDGE